MCFKLHIPSPVWKLKGELCYFSQDQFIKNRRLKTNCFLSVSSLHSHPANCLETTNNGNKHRVQILMRCHTLQLNFFTVNGFVHVWCFQISMKEHLGDGLLECTMQDLLRYDDYNNDGHLSLHEFYTAFRKRLFIAAHNGTQTTGTDNMKSCKNHLNVEALCQLFLKMLF